MPAGRPTSFKKEYCDAVIRHMEQGASLTSFAADIDVSRSTINNWMEQHPEFLEAVKRGKARCAAWWERKGREGAAGESQVNPTLVIFGLKNMAPDDWRDKQEHDHRSGDGSMTPKGIDASQLSDAALQELMNARSSESD